MCYRYLAPDLAEIEDYWDLSSSLPVSFSTRHDAYPTTPVPVLLPTEANGLHAELLRWGLIPSWWRQETAPRLTYNARSEEAARKPLWRDSYRFGRCLMPAWGWTEWRAVESGKTIRGKEKTVKQPYFIYSPQEEMIAFAALWARWRSFQGEEIKSCALLTREASSSLSFIHNRMPVVLPRELQADWLDPSQNPEALGRIVGSARQEFAAKEVGSADRQSR